MLKLTPSSLLVPLNLQVTFFCETTCSPLDCNVYWYLENGIINNHAISSPDTNITIKYNRLMVNATTQFNIAVEFSCEVSLKGDSAANRSNYARFQVVVGK